MTKRFFVHLLALATICCHTLTLASESVGYNKPPENILKVMQAPPPPLISISPSKDRLMLVTQDDYPSIARMATPILKLAGLRVEINNHSRHDTPGGYGIIPCATDYILMRVSDKHQTKIDLPKGACASSPTWSVDGKRFLFSNRTETSVDLWIGDGETGVIHQIPHIKLNNLFGISASWMADQRTLVVKTIPENMGPMPAAPAVPSGPSIQEAKGEKGQSSTYEARDTLKNKYDEQLFDYFATSQLMLIDTVSGAQKLIGKPALYDYVNPAPDGVHILVTNIKRPYSYVTAYNRFPRDVEIWNSEGKVVYKVASLPLADRVPIHGVPTGPRDYSWQPNEPATLIYAEALDGGDWNVNVPHRDKVMSIKAPFTKAPAMLLQTEQRYGTMDFGDTFALIHEYDDNKHWDKIFILNPNDFSQKPELLWDLSSDERYADPGNPVRRFLPNGFSVIKQEGDSIYLSGYGASPDGDRPFLDKLDLKTRTNTRLFRSDKAALESFVTFLGDDTNTFMTWHQTPLSPPNAYIRTLTSPQANPIAGEAQFQSTLTRLTNILDPTPEIRSIEKRLVTYKRADGVDLSFTIYTPPHYKKGTRVPTILYAYPLDYAQSSTAGQVTGSQMTFTRLRQYRLLLLAGYAIIDNAAFPIVGDPKTAYDTYLEQLVADATAAVNKAVEIGIADPNRIGVTGHSHGALMTVNLLAHSNLFKAGVATSGAYNKILTPFGFQNERRSIWQAPEVYKQVSPFFFADKLKTPLVLIHGEDDANPGTTPMQTRLLYEAIRGNGGVVRQVMLPFEPHWYTAMESSQQLIYEMVRWFDLYVKNAQPSRS